MPIPMHRVTSAVAALRRSIFVDRGGAQWVAERDGAGRRHRAFGNGLRANTRGSFLVIDHSLQEHTSPIEPQMIAVKRSLL